MMNEKVFLLISAIAVFTGCTKEEPPLFNDMPVVEAYLKDGDEIKLQISRQVPFEETSEFAVDDLDNLEITLTTSDGPQTMESVGNGCYAIANSTVEELAEYSILFTYGELIVSAETIIPHEPEGYAQSDNSLTVEEMTGPPTSMPDPIELIWDNPDNSFYMVVVENIEEEPDPISAFSGERTFVFRNEPTQNNTYELRSQQFSYYGTHLLLLYHLNEDYAALYDDGETSSLNLTNPSTTIDNGVGIFTGMSADTLYLEVLPG